MSKPTPCERLGFKVGDRFVVRDSTIVSDGSTVKLSEDDGTSIPRFRLLFGESSRSNGSPRGQPRTKGGFMSLDSVTKITDQPQKEECNMTTPIRDNIGARVQAVRSCFFGEVPAGTQGTVVAPRDPGVNVVWDNGYSEREGSATLDQDRVKVISESVVTPHQGARYIVRILTTPNPTLVGTFVKAHVTGSPRVVAKAPRERAKEFTYDEVINLLRDAKYSTFEVLLAPVKTGRAKPVHRGNNGWAVGDRLHCELSAHPAIPALSIYTVDEIDEDGDELTVVDGRRVFLKYGALRRNEYTALKGK